MLSLSKHEGSLLTRQQRLKRLADGVGHRDRAAAYPVDIDMDGVTDGRGIRLAFLEQADFVDDAPVAEPPHAKPCLDDLGKGQLLAEVDLGHIGRAASRGKVLQYV